MNIIITYHVPLGEFDSSEWPPEINWGRDSEDDYIFVKETAIISEADGIITTEDGSGPFTDLLTNPTFYSIVRA